MDYNNLGVYNFGVIQGINHAEIFKEWLINGQPLNLTTLDEIKVDFKKSINSAHSSLTLTTANGGLIVENNTLQFVFGENTKDVPPGVYLYDILMVKDGVRNIYVRGEMTIYPVITK